MASEEARGTKVPAVVDEFEEKRGTGFAWTGDPAAELTKLLGAEGPRPNKALSDPSLLRLVLLWVREGSQGVEAAMASISSISL